MSLILPSKFITTVTKTWGNKGKQWLDQLPQIVDNIKAYWLLTDIQPITNMSYHFVAFAKKSNKSVAIKIGCDTKTYQSEKNTLAHFSGQGSVQLIGSNDNYQSLLLKRVQPGRTLKEINILIENKMKAYAEVVHQLLNIPSTGKKFIDCQKWCEAIDRIEHAIIKPLYIKKAQQLRGELINSMDAPYVCHGDLHLENIIQSENSWLSIDPHGVIGEKAYEVSAFDLIQANEIVDVRLMDSRLNMLAQATGVSYNRLVAWVFLRCVVSAQWFIEDEGDPNQRLRDIEILYLLIR